ncbi:zinc finger protein Pegasus [Boleophthalmus pectinirostris]|uniref:zinc finger protein Pegasus n=1 Tax=Boleophthalmus pectinirostris TaxID=150288 RepID=UPI0024322580|nr:zinc finger protein Pegasus [Boleophthalmus pectinirostris]
MEGIKTESVDFVKEFQEYLSQQTQHVNMISGSVCGEKETTTTTMEQHYPNNIHETQAAAQSPVEPSPPDMSLSLGEAPDVQMEGLERTSDGKYKCSYCSYSNKGMARLVEHIRIHTGEKPHRCQLCPFASAYERHLEAHMRSHTGEKPYKCDQCAFRCSDRSNLSHHRRRRHKLLPSRVPRLQQFNNKRIHSALQKRQNSLGYARRLVLNYNPGQMLMQKNDYLNEFSHKHHDFRNIQDIPNLDENRSCLPFTNPLDQLSTLAGQLSDPTPDSSENLTEEKPIIIQEITSQAKCTSSAQTSSSPASQNCSPTPGISFEHNANSSSQANSPTRAALDEENPQKCVHCDIQFADNILYTIHMGCHGYKQPFQCNVCGHLCKDKYDFACHFARGQHKK